MQQLQSNNRAHRRAKIARLQRAVRRGERAKQRRELREARLAEQHNTQLETSLLNVMLDSTSGAHCCNEQQDSYDDAQPFNDSRANPASLDLLDENQPTTSDAK